MTRTAAASGEHDIATREYRYGDDLRRVHWRSTARRGELMVRRDEQPHQMQATVLVDRRAVGHRGDGPGLVVRVGGQRRRVGLPPARRRPATACG